MDKILEAIKFFSNVKVCVNEVSTEKDKANHQKVVVAKYKYEGKEFLTKNLYYKNISYLNNVRGREKESAEQYFEQPVYWLDIGIHKWPKGGGENDLNTLVVQDMYDGENDEFKSFLLKLANNDNTGYIQTITKEGKSPQYGRYLENNNHWHDIVLLIKAFINSEGEDIDKKYFSSLVFMWHKGKRISLSKAYGSRGFIDELQKNIKLAFKELNKMENRVLQLLQSNKNLILTGAPGTGKTYLAKEIAKQMIGVKTDKELADSGQFAFVQFHPSYDYTDFVEGLRPTQPDENGNIGFELKDGVFKEFCKKALKGRIDNFENSWNNLLNLVRDNLAKKQLTKIGSWEYSLSTKDSLKYSSIDTPSGYTFTITKQNVYNAYQDKKARPSGAFQKEMEEVVKFMKKNCGLKNYQQVKASQNKNYIFVIDEINRGEISKIFGELFFSIDPGYRGEKGRVQTQYANLIDKEDAFKDGFYVPENVHIIGTMNDIDRSVESFDFAMRRRFTWEEITSEESAKNMNLPEEIKVKMRSLNKKISSIEGLNSSYHIGGAYFLDSEGNAISEDKMDDVWKLRLRPLLKEYLRGMPDSENLLNDLKGVYGVKENDKTTSKSGEQNDNDNDETEQ